MTWQPNARPLRQVVKCFPITTLGIDQKRGAMITPLSDSGSESSDHVANDCHVSALTPTVAVIVSEACFRRPVNDPS